MPSAGVTLRRAWADQDGGDGEGLDEWLLSPRDDLVAEEPADNGTFVQRAGPFTEYRRKVERTDRGFTETLHYRLIVPWFGWLFRWATRHELGKRRPGYNPAGRQPWWAPPDRLDPRQVTVLGMLAAASMSAAFVNTLFTQTIAYSADDFGVGDWAKGLGGTAVRLGVVLAIPFAMLADRIGRRRVIVAMAWAAPLTASLGGLAPSFPALVATQAVGRPLGIALDLLVAVVAAEEMPRNSRAYAVSVLAMANGLGAGVAVVALPISGISQGSWRGVYAISLLWLPVAVSLARRLPETHRFQRAAATRHHRAAPQMRRGRLIVQAAVAFCANLLVAPASLFQVGYLKDERGFSPAMVSLFTLSTATPAGLGLIIGGRIADRYGRRGVASVCVPAGALLLVLSFAVGGPLMWSAALTAGIVSACAYPAMAVYRSELFGTGRRGLANALIQSSALIGGAAGLLIAGAWLDVGTSHGMVMAAMLVGPFAVSAFILTTYPETAHKELEDLNPEDARAP